MEVQFKVISSSSPELFERRLNEFVASLDRDDIVVDVKFATTAVGTSVEYSAVVQYQTTQAWDA